MKKIFFIVIGVMMINSHAVLGQMAIQWQKCIGGTGIDFGKGVCLSADSSAYFVSGYTASANGDMSMNYGGMDIFVSKMDLNGNLLWTKVFGSPANDYVQCIISTHDNGILVAGFTNDSVTPGTHGGFDVLLLKLDSAGNQEWRRFYGGDGNEGDHFSEIIETSDFGYVCITGTGSGDGDVDTLYGSSDFWLFKTDSLGNMIWEKNFGGTGDEDGHAILPMPDGGFILAGHTASNDIDVTGLHNPVSGIHDGWVLRVDSSLNIKWQKCFGGNDYEVLSRMCLNNSGVLVLTGFTSSVDGDISGNHGLMDAWSVKVDTADGSLLSSRVYGGGGNDYAYFLLGNTDGSITYSGYSNSTNGNVTGNHGGIDYWIFKTDSLGNIVWGNSYGGSGNEMNLGGITSAPGGGNVICGLSGSVNGDVTGNHGANDCWVIKINCQNPVPSFSCSPNPSCMSDTVFFTNTSTGALSYEWYINGVPNGTDTNNLAVFHNAGRDTVLLITKFDNCSDSLQQIISVNDLPIVNLGHDTAICSTCVLLLNSGNPGAAFLWSTGDTAQQIMVAGPDTIWVEVSNGCTGSDTIIISIDTLTGVMNSEKNEFMIFPNPTTGIINVKTGTPDEYYLDVLLPDGRIVSTMGPYQGNAVIDLNLPGSGCFLAVIRNAAGMVALKTLLGYRPH
ncbi:MAG TPA: hypothetical protein PKW80_15550 [Bacteroidales bacterium]|nr:hypothetical protein [Bacteroidales bacterium]